MAEPYKYRVEWNSGNMISEFDRQPNAAVRTFLPPVGLKPCIFALRPTLYAFRSSGGNRAHGAIRTLIYGDWNDDPAKLRTDVFQLVRR